MTTTAAREFGRQLRLDIAFEDLAVHCALDDPRRDEAIAAQAGNEGRRAPMSEGRVRQVALTLRRRAGALGQPGVGRGFIMKTRRPKTLAKNGFRPVKQRSRAALTSGRSCSLAPSVFCG